MARPANRTQITKAVLRLRELIWGGQFRPGERMAELTLVELLGVSRTPLRLALAELEHEGLLRGLPGGGYVVREFSEGDVRDAIELRGVLEGTAARFAAERGATTRDLKALKAINDTIRRLVHRSEYETLERYMELNEEFHARLVAMAGSPMLARALEGIVSLPFAGPSAFVMADVAESDDTTGSIDILIIAHVEHEALIEAIARRESGRAEHIAREHARLALRNVDIILAHSHMREQLPGASLIALPEKPTPEPV